MENYGNMRKKSYYLISKQNQLHIVGSYMKMCLCSNRILVPLPEHGKSEGKTITNHIKGLEKIKPSSKDKKSNLKKCSMHKWGRVKNYSAYVPNEKITPQIINLLRNSCKNYPTFSPSLRSGP